MIRPLERGKTVSMIPWLTRNNRICSGSVHLERDYFNSLIRIRQTNRRNRFRKPTIKSVGCAISVIEGEMEPGATDTGMACLLWDPDVPITLSSGVTETGSVHAGLSG